MVISFSKSYTYAEILPVYPPNGAVLEDPYISLKWINTDPSTRYVYSVCYSYEKGMYSSMCFFHTDNENTFLQPYRFLPKGVVRWVIKYHPEDSFVKYPGVPNGYFKYTSVRGVFGINMEVPIDELVQEEEIDEDEEEVIPDSTEEVTTDIEEIEEPIVIEDTEEPIPITQDTKEEVVIENKVVDIPKGNTKKSSAVNVKKNSSSVSPTTPVEENTSDYVWNVASSISKKSDVLGTSTKNTDNVVCKFKYISPTFGSNILLKEFCNIPEIPYVTSEIYEFGDEYSISVDGEIINSFKIQVDEYKCSFTILNTSTWFKCKEKFVKTHILDVSPNINFTVFANGKNVVIRSFNLNSSKFGLSAGYTRNTNDVVLKYRYRIVNSQFNIFEDMVKEYKLNPTKGEYIRNENRPFVFPFNKTIGVTQWHGYTDYESPHTGIDFGATKEDIVAIGDGTVIAKGYDTYYGECMSGGNYIILANTNGMYTAYFHLEETYVSTGQNVTKGQVIAKTGNSGSWNCQKLGYHLHLETRSGRNQNTHVNPVEYISTDWNSIVTLNSSIYSGRLSGDNPHLSF